MAMEDPSPHQYYANRQIKQNKTETDAAVFNKEFFLQRLCDGFLVVYQSWFQIHFFFFRQHNFRVVIQE